MKKHIILLGPPGCGKGTQSIKIKLMYNYIHISTGDIIRQNIKNNTKYSFFLSKYLNKGKLVPDNLVFQLIKQYLIKKNINNNVIWDGFPRTVKQAKKLNILLNQLGIIKKYIFYFKIDKLILINRLLGRLLCLNCNRIYNISSFSVKTKMICNYDKTQLSKRKDDNFDKILVRLQEYQKFTKPLIEFYLLHNCLTIINANQNIDIIWKNIISIVDK